MYLPVNFDIDPLPHLRPPQIPTTVLNHPPLVRMENHSLPPLGEKVAKYQVPGDLITKPGKYQPRLPHAEPCRADLLHALRRCHQGNGAEHERADHELPRLRGGARREGLVPKSRAFRIGYPQWDPSKRVRSLSEASCRPSDLQVRGTKWELPRDCNAKGNLRYLARSTTATIALVAGGYLAISGSTAACGRRKHEQFRQERDMDRSSQAVRVDAKDDAQEEASSRPARTARRLRHQKAATSPQERDMDREASQAVRSRRQRRCAGAGRTRPARTASERIKSSNKSDKEDKWSKMLSDPVPV